MRYPFLFFAVIFLYAGSAFACFGPKLYVGVSGDDSSAIMYELVSLYLKEKTGIETVPVDLAGKDPFDELDRDGIDMLISSAVSTGRASVLQVDGCPPLFAGKRPCEDIQFTTVLPALSKLAALLTLDDLNRVLDWTKKGDSPAASVRRLLMEKGWI